MKTVRFILLVLSLILFTSCTATREYLPRGEDAAWDLVVIGDSSLWKLADAFAAQIEADLGIQVEARDFTIGNLSAGSVLEVLRGGVTSNARLERLPDALREADVVVMFVNPEDSVDPKNPMEFGACFMYQAPSNCEPETFNRYVSDLKGIWTQIMKLRRGKETILRAVDLYNPLVAGWQEKGVFTACTECWENLSQAVRTAAEAKNIPFLSRLDAFNGPDHSEDPRQKGYIVEDGEHPSDLAAAYTSELLAAMGYEPTMP